jgi:hypothetical protein
MTSNTPANSAMSRRGFLFAAGGTALAATLGGSLIAAGPAAAATWGPGNPLFDAKWGLFLQFISDPYAAETLSDWNRRVDAFDVNTYASQVAASGAGFVILHLQQGSDKSCSPLPANPNIQTSTRDLPLDLYNALNPHGIKLLLYQASDRPYQSQVVSALTTYSQRYGTKVAGWFIDGGASGTYLQQIVSACLSGNPAAQIIGPGELATVDSFEGTSLLHSVHQRYPHDSNINGWQATCTTYMSQWWGRDGYDPHYPDILHSQPGPRYTDSQIINAMTQYIAAGGFITIDVPVYATDTPSTTITPVGPAGKIGTILPSYIGQLNALGAAIAQITTRNSPGLLNNYVDDHGPGTSYTGSWGAEPGANLSISDYGTPAQYGGGDAATSSTAGATASYTFYGNSINLISRTWNYMGKADVAIDGTPDATIDLYSPTQKYQQVVYSKAGLALGNHTITVTVRADRNPASTGNLITIDAFEPGSDRIEGESMCRFGGASVFSDSNASRGMYVGNLGQGAGVEYPSPRAATSLTLRYAAPSGGTFSLYVNGTKKASVPLAGTGSWTSFADVTVPVTVKTGDTVTFQRDTGANIDYVVDRLEAEFGTLLGGAQVEAHSNASNGKNVGSMSAVGDGVSFTGVDATTRLQIGYAAATSGTFSLYINGTKNQTINFPATGGWNTFSTITVNTPIPADATITLKSDTGDTAINLDYIAQ